MFTGIIEAVGVVADAIPEAGNLRIVINTPVDVIKGESVAVNGVCLTITETTPGQFACQAVAETLRGTTLVDLRRRVRVNLERALVLGARLGGHFVAGHVDEVGSVLAVRTAPGSRILEFGVSEEGSKYLVPKGSVAIDGVSLTVSKLRGRRFEVSVIPYTLEATTLSELRAGSRVNVEFDLLGKHVARLLEPRPKSDGLRPASDSDAWAQGGMGGA
ncbi:MAG: riboflavin synthase [candidate division WOR-3 bacterium]